MPTNSINNRPYRQNIRPQRFDSPASRNLNMRDKNYKLNTNAAIDKKIESCNRELIKTKTAAGGNIIIDLSSSTYEALRHHIPTFYNESHEYAAIQTRNKDSQGLVVEEMLQVRNRLRDGNIGKYKKFTINMYHTTCRILVNGKEAQSVFLDIHLQTIAKSITSNKETLEQLDAEIKEVLQSYNNIDSNAKPANTVRNAANTIVQATCQPKKQAIETIQKQNNTKSQQIKRRSSHNIQTFPKTIDSVDHKCQICDKEVEINDRAIECSECSNWYHFKCEEMTETDIKLHEENQQLRYECITCQTQTQKQTVIATVQKQPFSTASQNKKIQSLVKSPGFNTETIHTNIGTGEERINDTTIENTENDEAKKLKDLDEKLNRKEKMLAKKEKDLKKLELDYNDKADQMAARKTYIAKLENQIKDLQQSNHIMKIQLAAGESSNSDLNSLKNQISDETTTTSQTCGCQIKQTQISNLDQLTMQNNIKLLEYKIEMIEKTHQLENDMLKMRISHLEEQLASDRNKSFKTRKPAKWKANQYRNEFRSNPNEHSNYHQTKNPESEERNTYIYENADKVCQIQLQESQPADNVCDQVTPNTSYSDMSSSDQKHSNINLNITDSSDQENQTNNRQSFLEGGSRKQTRKKENKLKRQNHQQMKELKNHLVIPQAIYPQNYVHRIAVPMLTAPMHHQPPTLIYPILQRRC